MDPDDLQQAWQAQATHTRVAIDADLLSKEVRRNQSNFRSTIARRDVIEVGVALVLLPYWFYAGITKSLPWTWWLGVPALIWVAGFLIVDRIRHKPRRSEPHEPLLESVKESLKQVEHQIWLLRNVFWWYLAPLGFAILAFFTQVTWRTSDTWLEALTAGGFSFTFLIGLYYFIYYINQSAVRTQLEPRRQELSTLLTSLGNETAGEGQGDPTSAPVSPSPALRSTASRLSPSRTALAWLVIILIMLAVSVLMLAVQGGISLLGAVDPPREPAFEDVSTFGEDDASRIDAWLREQVERSEYPSLSVAIVRDGEIVYRGAFGFEDVNEGRKATPQTLYPVASVTKAFTASLAAMLHERGVVDLDQPVAKYLPSGVSLSTTPEVGATITLRQLASHTSGLPRGVPGRVQSAEGWYALEPQRLYDHLADVELNSAPGTAEEYSNLGFGLLGHALERAAGKPFDRLLQELICEPLQLKQTAIPVDGTLRPATGYDDSSWRFEREESVRERLAASGGLVTTVEDLAKFLSAQIKSGVFSPESLKQLHTPSKLSNGSESGTALGWSVHWSRHVGRFLEKNGGRSNCSAWIGFSPEHRVGVAIVTNCGGPDVDPMGRWLLERSIPLADRPSNKFGSANLSSLIDGGDPSLYEGPARSSGPEGNSLANLVTKLRKEKNLVSLAATVTVDGQVAAAASHGERKVGSGLPIELGDRWHLGGITKSVTATMIARLIESGGMRWADTVDEAFPDSSIHEDWKPVTLRQLLTDTAGAPASFPKEVSRNRPPLGPEATQARLDAVLKVIAEKPAHPRGKSYAYSNVGYTIAGAMAEKATGVAWENLVKREVFEPLALTDSGFGPPKSADDPLEQPRGHWTLRAGKVAVDDQADNTAIIAPSGMVHMSLHDLCTYAGEHLRGHSGAGTLLSAETYKLLHTPELRHNACGWVLREPTDDIPHRVYWHNGSNTYWYALVVFIPDTNTVIAVISNDSDSDSAEAAAWEIVKARMKR